MDHNPLPPVVPGVTTLLIVDDIDVVRRSTARMLSEEGYRVFEAGSVDEALEVLTTSKRSIDLALLDVIMPDVDGISFSRILRDRWPETRVLYISAYGAEIMAQEGLRDLNAPFLAKPFTRRELLWKVHEALTRHARIPKASNVPGSPNAPRGATD
jgi:DNA-binding response OmpR family regulator